MSSLALLLCGQLKEVSHPPYIDKESEIVAVLKALQTCEMTIDLLQSTKVGVLVNSIKKALSTDGATLCKALIAKWKETATAQTAVAAPCASSSATVETFASTASTSSASSISQLAPPSPSASSSLSVSSESPLSHRKRHHQDSPSSPSPLTFAALRSSSVPLPKQQPAYTLDDLPRALSPLPLPPHDCTLSTSSSSPSASAASASPLPFYNPNLHASLCTLSPPPADDDDGEEQDDTVNEDDHYIGDVTSRKRTKRSHDVDLSTSSSLPPPPSHPVLICSLVQMCIDCLSSPASLSSLRSLGPIPIPLALQILSKATADQLKRIETFNEALKEETDHLWKLLVEKKWPDEKDLDGQRRKLQKGEGGKGGWRALYEWKVRQKDERLARLGQRLKTRVEEERKDKKEKQGIKIMDLKTATKVQEKRKGRRGGIVAGGGGRGVGDSDDRKIVKTVNRLSMLRKETTTLQKQFWASRPTS